MPEPGSPEFHREYARLIAGTAPEEVGPRAFAALAKSYRKSQYFTRLKPRTQDDYTKVIAYIVKVWGNLPVAKARTKDVIRAQNECGKGVRFGNYIVAVLSVMFEHARAIGWREDNPAKGVKKIKAEGKEREPWPADLIAAYRSTAKARALLVFELCLGTGQRIGDVLKMRWDDIKDGGVWVKQNKRGARLWIPITPILAATLDRTARGGLTIVTGLSGRPASYRVVADEIMAARKRIGAEAYDIHCLRYTAAAQMAALGLDDDTIKAVTGHASGRMVAKYAGQVRQITRAKKAQEGRE
jgi:integrase